MGKDNEETAWGRRGGRAGRDRDCDRQQQTFMAFWQHVVGGWGVGGGAGLIGWGKVGPKAKCMTACWKALHISAEDLSQTLGSLRVNTNLSTD